MAQTDQLKKSIFIMFNNEPYFITDAEFYSPGKGSAFTRVKMKNLNTGRVIPFTFKSGERVEELDVNFKTMQFLYSDTNISTFMDPTNYEQFSLSNDLLGNYLKYMKAGSDYILIVYNEQPISIKFPPQVVLEVTETSAAVKGNTANSATKEATLETGAVIQVPLFIDMGTKIKVDPEYGTYMGRVTE
ncbi:elongation factor P [Candidatus Dojkabacteria bacterium CG_4_9_14_3_um_filter_150_Dojkabacteria_WS6_41_13]|nr:MAG: elongation factor P [Candidatus Dojkabacteria bacterium CG_4_9_14_3_um_filter_150_Dojkabacteria_WS6_41_13]